MKIIVCVKQIVDPEEPPESFQVDDSARQVILPQGTPYVINPFDRQAVEAALCLRDVHGGSVIAISLGDSLDRTVARDPASMGADELILLEDDVFANADSQLTAHALSEAIRKIGDYDLILCGRQAADTDAGLVGPWIAGKLGLACITVAKKIEPANGSWKIERVTDAGTEIVSAPMPAVVTVSNEIGEPRYPTIKQVMAAKRIKPEVWRRADIETADNDITAVSRPTKTLKFFKPSKEGQCEMIGGESAEMAGANLAEKLTSEKIISINQ